MDFKKPSFHLPMVYEACVVWAEANAKLQAAAEAAN
jgi:hypothetical protein